MANSDKRKVRAGMVVYHVTAKCRGVVVSQLDKKDQWGRNLVVRWGNGECSRHAYGYGADDVMSPFELKLY